MKNNLKALLVIFALFFMQANLLGDTQAINEIPIKPDAHIQTQISRIILIAHEEESFTSEKALSEISKLKEMGGLEHLLQQLFYFQLNTNRMYHRKEITGEDEDAAWWGVHRLSGILLGITDEDSLPITYASAESAINAVLPYLETKNQHFKEDILHIILATVESVGAHESDYSKYELYIEKRKDNPPLLLIKYMYEDSDVFYRDSTGEALLALMHVYTKKPETREPIIQAEKVIRDDIVRREHGQIEDRHNVSPEAMKVLNEFSKHEQWWVRLYVAEILSGKSEFCTPKMIRILENDKHPLVKEVMREKRLYDELTKRKLDAGELLGMLAEYITEFLDDPQLRDKVWRIESLTVLKRHSKYSGELENDVETIEKELTSLPSLLKEKFLEGKFSFKKFCLLPLKKYTWEGTLPFRKLLITEFLTDPEVIAKANQEELEELKVILKDLSQEIPEAKEVLEK